MTDIEKVISTTLRVGVLASSAFVIAGLALFYVEGAKTTYDTSHYSLTGVFRGLLAAKPEAIILVGVIILVATPVLRVLESAVDFAAKKDKLYLALSLIVLATMLVGIALLPRLFGA